jgi:hypothetical protein
VLGTSIAGVILHGSLVLGGYVSGRSDVDLLVVVEEALGDEQVDGIEAVVVDCTPYAPGRVDLRFVTRAAAASPAEVPLLELGVEISAELDSGYAFCRQVRERDLVVEFSMARAHGHNIIGPRPDQLIGEVPDEWVLKVGDTQLADWQRIGDDPANAELTVLTASRIWRYALESHHCTKVEAGEWALKQDPRLEVVRDALRQRSVDSTAVIDPAGVQALLGRVRRVVQTASESTS